MKLIVILLALLGVHSSQAAIKPIQSMSEILPYLTQDTLVVFDLDNTVIHPVQTLGSDQWFQHLLLANTVDQSVSIWSDVQPYTQVSPVEALTPGLIAQEQSRGVKVMALTARPATLATVTEHQLASIGVDFEVSPVYGKDLMLGDVNGPQFINGVEFVSPKFTKGQALVALLNQIGYKPARVVFIDDTPKHTVTVNQALDAAGIENFEFRYGADDVRVAAYNADVANEEYKVFENCGRDVISDALATSLIQTGNASGTFFCPN